MSQIEVGNVPDTHKKTRKPLSNPFKICMMDKTSNSRPQDKEFRWTRIRNPTRKLHGLKRQLCSFKTSEIFCLLIGFCVGYTIMVWRAMPELLTQRVVCPQDRSDVKIYNFKQPVEKQFMLIAVMTTRKFLETRALDIRETWGSRVPGSILYFVGGAEAYTGDLPVVTLNNINDTLYPPQRKSFTMIEFISKTLADHYEWFLRSDDDIYIRTDRLELLLRRLDSSKAWFIGQPGYGLEHEWDKLGMVKPYCMGGVGITFSRSVLVKVGKHLVPDCLNSMVTSHEDTELGRCVYKYTGQWCTDSPEMWSAFVNYNGKYTTHAVKLSWLERGAITLHPIKDHPHMQRIDSLYSDHKVRQLQQKMTNLEREISDLDETLKTKMTAVKTTIGPANDDLILESNVGAAHHHDEVLEPDIETANGEVVLESDVGAVNDDGLVLESISTPNVEFGKSSPKSGTMTEDLPKFIDKERGYEWDYLDRHLYLNTQRSGYHSTMTYIFMAIFFKSKIATELEIKYGTKFELKSLPFAYSRLKSGTDKEVIFQHKDDNNTKHLIKTIQKLSGIQFRELVPLPDPETWVILPLFERTKEYRRFLEMLVRAVEKNGKLIKLKVVLYEDEEGHFRMTQEISNHFRNCSRHLLILTILTNGTFSRGRALSKGTEQLPLNSLLIFMDVDMSFDEHFLHRADLNTIRGKQVWFPICFSQFNPTIACYGKEHCSMENNHGDDFGLWRDIGFGIASMYKQDLIKVGGFDLEIEGWGGEDNKLYEQFIRTTDLQVFRTADPSLIHIYHEKSCNRDGYRFFDCLRSKWVFYGSENSLANIVLDKGYSTSIP